MPETYYLFVVVDVVFPNVYNYAEQFFLDDPELQDEVPPAYLSHKELYEYGIRKATIIFRKIRQLQDEGKDGVDNYL